MSEIIQVVDSEQRPTKLRFKVTVISAVFDRPQQLFGSNPNDLKVWADGKQLFALKKGFASSAEVVEILEVLHGSRLVAATEEMRESEEELELGSWTREQI